ncbi:hypothetical protein Cni_G27842 [Canna indica]|uniref:Uncharacterized protein n=1 Tax=Canna indica TaxID=4628 RepID=A0AAQ3L6B6_9LILI|nr:hypothetical protein Cni_G27842 [Canna indica]
MRAVKGTVVSLKPISLSKAAAVLSRFAANDKAARPEVAAYVRRASAAFDELVRIHREIRAASKHPELEKLREEKSEEERKKKRKKRSRNDMEAGDDGIEKTRDDGEIGDDTDLVAGNRYLHGSEAEVGGGGEKKKKKRKMANDEEKSELAVKAEKNLVKDGNLVEQARHYGDGALLVEGGKRRKKKAMTDDEGTSRLHKDEEKPGTEEERHKDRKKKKKHKVDRKEEVTFEVLDQNHRTYLNVGEDLRDLKDKKEQPKKKKKKNERRED